MPEDIRSQIRHFVSSRFPQITFADDEDIFEMGFVNSLFAMELVMFVEKILGTQLPNQEMRLDHFRTVESMVELVNRMSSVADISVP
jgi:acyl carrier protein